MVAVLDMEGIIHYRVRPRRERCAVYEEIRRGIN
jgi:hypothetical protein